MIPYLVTSDDELRQYLPNALQTVEGEASFFDRIKPDLLAAERWLTQYVVAPSSLRSMPDEEAQTIALGLARRIVVADALLRAIPQLDMVLTPNGFGVVSNQNIAPASRDRVERLLASLERQRDHALRQLLPMLYIVNGGEWYKSDQGRYFSSTLFPFLDLPALMGETAHQWEQYQLLQPRVILIEHELADKFISQPLYDRLRFNFLHNCYSLPEIDIINRLRAVELALLKGEPLNMPVLTSLVNFIRNNPDDFPEWQESDTARRYEQTSFQNKKNAAGYWW